MSKHNILPADVYVVINKSLLSDQSRKVLTMLYQPIVGSRATSLYFTLWSYLDQMEVMSEEWTHHHLLSRLQLSLDEVIEAREKLEAMGLIRSYVKEQNGNYFVYEMYAPITPHEFFRNPILNTTLLSNVGKKEYESIRTTFQTPKISLTEYEDVSKSFTDVFSVSYEELVYCDASDMKHSHTRELEIKSDLDLHEVFGLIPDDLLNHNSVTKEIKDLVYKLTFIYSFGADEIRELIKSSLKENKTIDKDLLKKNAKNYFKFEHVGKLPNVVYKNQPESLRKKIVKDTPKNKMIYTFEMTSPAVFLASKSKDGVLSKADKDILVYLLVELNLNPGVVNVLLDYVLRINENKLIKAFIETIASQWRRSKIETVEEAMKLAEKEYRARKELPKTKTVTKKHVADKPKWLDEAIMEENNGQVSAEMEELLRKYR